MTKTDEIKKLRDLHGGEGYFFDEVSKADLEQMCQNIKDDHPIFFNTDSSKELDQEIGIRQEAERQLKLEKAGRSADHLQISDLEKDRDNWKTTADLLAANILKEDPKNSWVYDGMGRDRTIQIKLQADLILTMEDRDYLNGKLERQV